ncbi:unnamed protein product [Moneuplotes crassus]|uniref:USP domain-containing protein n=1 Tax=Euplotes crassus TaxID=5936 RepID=A0AAD1XFF5_EUPCR|nr:unnamed protein product [Moneuplotes crassus]
MERRRIALDSSSSSDDSSPNIRRTFLGRRPPSSLLRRLTTSRSRPNTRQKKMNEEERQKLLQQRRQKKEENRKKEEKVRKEKEESRSKQRLELLDEEAKEVCKKYKVQWENTDKETAGENLECWKAIKNPSLNCFMIASMQSLLSLPEFVKYFSDGSDGDLAEESKEITFSKELNPNAKVSCLMQDLLKEYYDSDTAVLDVTKVRSEFSANFPESEMHDSCQFILALLNILENELNPSEQQFIPLGIKNNLEAWKKYQEACPSIVGKLFVGMEETIYQCKKCSHERKIYEEFKNMSIKCTPKASIKGFIEFLSQLSSSEEIQMKCKKCKNIQDLVMKKRIIRYPKYLMLVIGRKDPFTQEEIKGFVDYPNSFVQFDPQSDKEITYTLNNVIINVNALHYSTYCKRGSRWVRLENKKVKAVHPSDLKSEYAYILFYEAKDLKI